MSIKFGIQIENQFGFNFPNLKEIALNLEKRGYESFFTCDHFFLDKKSESKDTIEAYTMLSALATVTSKIKLGTLVTSMSYRKPSMLAKILGSLDHISNGRVIIGLGAGWKEIEYNAYGYRFPPLKERMDRLEEGIQIIIKMLTEDKPTYKGKYYQIENALNAPKPKQKPYPPILIGGTGRKRTLKMTAKYAQMWNIGMWEMTQMDEILSVLKDHCKNEGRDYNSIEKTFYGFANILETEEEIEKDVQKQAKNQNKTKEEIRNSYVYGGGFPGAFIGSSEDIIKRYNYLVEKDFTHFQVRFPLGQELAMSSKFSEQIMPNVK